MKDMLPIQMRSGVVYYNLPDSRVASVRQYIDLGTGSRSTRLPAQDVRKRSQQLQSMHGRKAIPGRSSRGMGSGRKVIPMAIFYGID